MASLSADACLHASCVSSIPPRLFLHAVPTSVVDHPHSLFTDKPIQPGSLSLDFAKPAVLGLAGLALYQKNLMTQLKQG